ncbi:MAG TPA: type II toxin-antitoxin system RelE/ParE family toxin [Gemmataceae bacterium]|nr:type II toxin-antitoxin system RelE/ParE family toxin [Gemmataceae bacterium]
MTFQVIFRPRADADVTAAVTWLACRNAAAAARWRTGLFRIVENFETNPNGYPIADEAVDLGVELRELLYGRRRGVYRILFTIEGQTVNIVRVRHAAQDRLAPDDL